MRVWSYVDRVALDDLQLVERPDPTPGPHDVVLRMRAAALNYRDLAIAAGHYHVAVGAPLIPVSDGVGEVVEVGAQVTRFRVGDLACPTYLPDWLDGPISGRVARRRLGGPCDGVLAELMCLHEDEAVRAPAHLDLAEAATLPVAPVTAWHSLFQSSTVRPGETVLVQGTGGVSTAAIQFARAAGARVVSIVRSEHHTAALRELGAHEVLPWGADADWPGRVMAATGGIDVAVNVAGGDTLAAMILTLGAGGRLHQVGYAAGTSATIDIFEAIRHAATILVATAGSRQDLENMAAAMELHGLRPAVATTFPVTQLREAMAALHGGGHVGKVVVTF